MQPVFVGCNGLNEWGVEVVYDGDWSRFTPLMGDRAPNPGEQGAAPVRRRIGPLGVLVWKAGEFVCG